MPMRDLWPLVVTVSKSSSLLSIFFMLLSQLHQAETQDFPSFKHPSISISKTDLSTFDQSHIIQQEMEKQIYLYKGSPKNLTFTFGSKSTITLSFVVTPCASEILWTLFVKRFVHETKDYRIHGQRRPGSRFTEEARFQNESRQIFELPNAPNGTYLLQLTSLHSDTWAKVLVTRNMAFQNPYPILPDDKTVHTKIKRRKLTVKWSPSPLYQYSSINPRYCVSISRIKNFKTHCSSLAYYKGDKKPSFPIWGFKDESRIIRQFRKKAKPIQKAKRNHIYYKCVGNKTSYTYKKFRRGRKYFIDVFVEHNGYSSTYSGTSVFRKRLRKSQRRKYSSMRLNKTKTFNLKKTKGVKILLTHTLPNIVINVVPCFNDIKLRLSYNNKKLRSESTSHHWYGITVSPARPGTYVMAFPGRRKKSSFVSVSTSKSSNSKVTLPSNMSVSVVESQITCSNVTLQWLESKTHQFYCLYKQPLIDSTKTIKNTRQRCLSPSERPKSERVFCERRKPSNPETPRIFTVGFLNSSTTYRFDLFIGSEDNGMVPYQSVKTTTGSIC